MCAFHVRPRAPILVTPNCTVLKSLRMDFFAQEEEDNKDLLSSINADADKKFEITHIDDKHERIIDLYREKINNWAKTKTNSIRRGESGGSKLYRPITDIYEIRVLEIKPGKPSDQLNGALHHCSVEFRLTDDAPLSFALSMNDLSIPVFYTALSYTWGAPNFDAEFECDGYVKMITRSLESALRHLRQEDRAVVLWVDQICIDQENNEEKAQQVPLMSRIYEHALNTAIWLGDSADGSDRAIKLLKDLHVRLRFSNEEFIDTTQFKRRNLPSPYSENWKALWKLLSRPWFERTWIIQEVTLSEVSWFICGNSVITWDSLYVACLQLVDTGISRWLRWKFPTSVKASDRKDFCRNATHLGSYQKSALSSRFSLLMLLVLSREARCTEPRDKVYGMFGICSPDDITVRVDYSDKYHVTQLFQDILERFVTIIELGQILRAVDHDSVELPSWVPDWRMPRRTTALGSSQYSYETDGGLKRKLLKGAAIPKVDSRNPTWKGLQVGGLHFDTLETLSRVFGDPYLNPTANNNKTLQRMLEFVVNLKSYPSPKTDFPAFWQTLVAGMDESRLLKCPDSFAEIFSYILDLITGKNGSISGQTYTRRQMLPKGRGGLDEEKLRSRKPRSAGNTFRQVRTAMINATKNRRLGGTSSGYIGLFPEHSQPGDGVYVLHGCHVPVVLRPRGDNKFKFVGECYVHGIMGGEAIGPNPHLQDIVLA